MKTSDLVLTLAGSKNGILMIEGISQFVTEEQMMEALQLGYQAILEICQGIESFQAIAGKVKKMDTLHQLPSNLLSQLDQV